MDIVKYDWSDEDFIHFDKVEYLGNNDKSRLDELSLSLEDGKHLIINETTFPDTFIIKDDVKFLIFVEGELRKVSKDIFLNYAQKNKDNLYKITDCKSKLIKIEELNKENTVSK